MTEPHPPASSAAVPAPAPAPPQGSPQQDFEAALHEIESNLSVRRLMIVIANVLVPACMMATVNALSGAQLPAQLVWLPNNILWIVGTVLAVGGVWTSAILARCHFGLVVNGTKMAKVRSGTLKTRGLNWLGVTTNFLGLTALSAGAGCGLALAALGVNGWAAVCIGAGVILLLIGMLRIQHGRANCLCKRLDPSWQQGEVSTDTLEEHARKSLDSTSADVAVVVTMGAALFAGTFDAACNLVSVRQGAIPGITTDTLQVWGVSALMLFTLVSLLLTGRIVVRLRIALAQHAASLAELRHEEDHPWRFSLWERSFLLFMLVAVLTSASGLIGAWTLGGPTAGAVTAGTVIAAHVLWYPIQLRRAASR